MTKDEFEAWTRDAEQKRDAALERYARAKNEEDRQRIAQEVAETLNEALKKKQGHVLKNLRKIIPAKSKSRRAAENKSKTVSAWNAYFVENDA